MRETAFRACVHPHEQLTTCQEATLPRMPNYPRTTPLGLTRQHSNPSNLRQNQHDLASPLRFAKHKSAPKLRPSGSSSPIVGRKLTSRLSRFVEPTFYTNGHNFSARRSGKLQSTLKHSETGMPVGLAQGTITSDASKNLTGFGLSSRFKHFCSTLSFGVQSSKRRLERK
jgi:hypothetical protein